MTIIFTIIVTLVIVLLLLNLHTPEKEIRHQVEHYHDILDPQFRREMGALLVPAIVPGNTIRALQNGDEIFPAMLQAIGAATRTITFETYIYWSGKIGNRFADALIERARASVRVHVMLDWVGSERIEEKVIRRMKD